MTRVLIRCDASLSIGSGHVIRCRTLARVLKARGANVSFLCRRQPGDLISILEAEFTVLELPSLPLVSCEGLVGRKLYAAWLGCSQLHDAEACLAILSRSYPYIPDWIIVDHYGLDSTWHSMILKSFIHTVTPKIFVIDDLADRSHHADLLLDQNFFGHSTHNRYKTLVPTHCRQFLGPHFSLLSPEYEILHPLVPVRTDLRRVLVFFGGVDPDNYTSRSIKILMDPAFSHLSVDVVLGIHSPHRQAVAKLVSQRPSTTLHAPLPSLAGLITRADLGIGAGGTTVWERACLKLPSLIIPIAANQLEGSLALEQHSCLMLLSNNDIDVSLRNNLLRLIADHALLSALSLESSKLVDGKGSSILCEQLLQRNG